MKTQSTLQGLFLASRESATIINPLAIARNVLQWQEQKRKRNAQLQRIKFRQSFNPVIR